MADDLADRLRGSGYRLTPQRQLILGAVEELGHATPDEVLAAVRVQASSVNASTTAPPSSPTPSRAPVARWPTGWTGCAS